jgi:SAM-dependent methyltransferase
MKPADDTFDEVARYYDKIMSHVDYDRWVVVAGQLAATLPDRAVHLDAACGTGTLAKDLRKLGWASFGMDLSQAMTKASRKAHPELPIACADMRALPLHDGVDIITCLFDSMNFLLSQEDLEAAFLSFSKALRPGGLLYFDVVTEQMVLQHFADQKWTDDNGRFETTWASTYAPEQGLSKTRIQIRNGPSCTVHEQIHNTKDIESALTKAGFTLLGRFDAESWKRPRKKSVRIYCRPDKNPSPLTNPHPNPASSKLDKGVSIMQQYFQLRHAARERHTKLMEVTRCPFQASSSGRARQPRTPSLRP